MRGIPPSLIDATHADNPQRNDALLAAHSFVDVQRWAAPAQRGDKNSTL